MMKWLARGGMVRQVTAEEPAAAPIESEGLWSAPSLPRPDRSAVSSAVLLGIELAIVIVWALVITRPYQNLDPQVWPLGAEWPSNIQSHHFWTRVRESGWAALWDGSQQGGAPALVQLHGAPFHPLVILTVLGWGVENGTKLALVGAFIVAGLAQWWLAKELGVGRVARVWSACMAVAGGQLAGRMSLGAFGAILCAGSAALVLPAVIRLARKTSRRAAVALGVVIALFILSAEGYYQVGLALVFPSAIFLLPLERARLWLLARRLALAVAMGLLLAAPLVVPFLLFMPQFYKNVDPNFGSAQTFGFVPLNLLVDDHQFYASEWLRKPPYPELYAHYIGWIPLILALWGVRGAFHGRERRPALFLGSMALLTLWIVSAGPASWLAHNIPIPAIASTIAGIRYISMLEGLAVPPLLALAALGLDRLLVLAWPRLQVAIAADGRGLQGFSLHAGWLLAIPLWMALTSVQAFGATYIGNVRVGGDLGLLDSLRTPDLEWVNPPFGEHRFIEPGVGMGLKMSSGFRPWSWAGRPVPEPTLRYERTPMPAGTNSTLVATVAGVYLYTAPNNEYAAVQFPDGGRQVVSAHGSGGNLQVTADVPRDGNLVLKENTWTGWRVLVDGKEASLLPGRWLSVAFPAGSHAVQFLYQPWDVPLGLALFVVGVALSLFFWLRRASGKADGLAGEE